MQDICLVPFLQKNGLRFNIFSALWHSRHIVEYICTEKISSTKAERLNDYKVEDL